MSNGQLVEFTGLTKRFRRVNAVSDLTARVEPGAVTGFLGPNGAGKTTTLRMLLGLVRQTSGTATIGGDAYRQLRHPLRTVGAALEAASFHPGRTAANHLRVYARAASIPAARVDSVLDTVGLTSAAGRKVGGFSLGMRQRLGLAVALLGDPGVVVLDEPANGLDPEGIIWMRELLRTLAAEGRTVLVSSHLLGEVQQTVDRLLIVSQGRLVFDGDIGELSEAGEHVVVADSPDRAALAGALAAAGIAAENRRAGLALRDVAPIDVGQIALDAGIPLSALGRRGPSLEETFLSFVSGERVQAGREPGEPETAAPPPLTPAPVGEPLPEAAPVETAASDDTAERAKGEPEAPLSEDFSDIDSHDEAATAIDIAAEMDAMVGGSPGASAASALGVASTGVIDVSGTAEEAGSPEDAHSTPTDDSTTVDADADADADADEDDEAQGEDIPAPRPAFSVAQTGVIEIVATDDTSDDEPADDRSADDEGGVR